MPDSEDLHVDLPQNAGEPITGAENQLSSGVFKTINAALQKLKDNAAELVGSSHAEVTKRQIDNDIKTVNEVEKRLKDRSAGLIPQPPYDAENHGDQPYADEDHKLTIYPQALALDPHPIHGRAVDLDQHPTEPGLTQAFLDYLEAEVPNDKKSLFDLIADARRKNKEEHSNGESEFSNNSKSWTIPTTTPGLDVHISHLFASGLTTVNLVVDTSKVAPSIS